MKVTFAKETALRILRSIRCGSVRDECIRLDLENRTGVVGPDPAPCAKWGKRLFDLTCFGLDCELDASNPVNVVVQSKDKRLRIPYVRNVVYDTRRQLPQDAFVLVSEDVAISCPELLFVEMGDLLGPAEHLLLGMELCGSFSYSPDDWRNGRGKIGIKPVTSVARIEAFVASIRWVRGVDRARQTLRMLADNAWSPTEAVVAVAASLPTCDFGYGLGRCELNVRVFPSASLAHAMTKASRVPDILFEGTTIGINYDGVVHLDLEGIANAGIEAGLHPETPAAHAALNRIVADVRAKAVDDIRRNRELIAGGYTVFPVTKEDLYDDGGLDKVMLQVMTALERIAGADLSRQREALHDKFARRQRQRLIWSLLPGSHEGGIETDLGLRYSVGELTVSEALVGF